MKCKIGIRPVIDGRWGGIRESLEEQTMAMALSAKKLIEENVRYTDGTPAEVIIALLYSFGSSAESFAASFAESSAVSICMRSCPRGM